MRLSQYRFNLPPEAIALHPAKQRDESRLMVINRKQNLIEHRLFKDVIDYFADGDVFVLNNTKVFPARLKGTKEKTGSDIEVFLLHELNKDSRVWDVLVEPARKIRIGNKLYFGDNDALTAEVLDNTTSRGRTLRFLFDGSYDKFKKTLFSLGKTPIPKYFKREPVSEDLHRFQTIFAKQEGAVLAPGAGLHFTRELFKRMEIKGIDAVELTMHISLGSYRDIEVEDLSKHKNDSEHFLISEETAQRVNRAKTEKREVCAVGTSVLRSLESAMTAQNLIHEEDAWTNKFLFPPYQVKVPTSLITNFHLPKSIMMITTSTFTGHEELLEYYEIALKEKYRFGPYGDAMLIL